MFKRKRLLLTITVLGGLIVFLIVLGIPAEKSVAAPGVPDTPETRQIQDTMNQAYKLMASAAQTFDVSTFSTVFVDTPDYELSAQQREAVSKIMGPKAVENAGYLTAMQAYYISWGNGAVQLEETLKNAAREQRAITADELKQIAKANGGRVPALDRQEPVQEPNLEFESITIRGNRATVRYDDGAALQEAILIKKEGHWFIAGIKPIWVHF
jgi:hypothetical protein